MSYKKKPLRMSITNMNNGRSLEAQFNPDELEEIIEANWNELTVHGMSHQPAQYSHTSNHAINFKLGFDALDNGGGILVTNDAALLGQERQAGSTQNRLPDIMLGRNFLLSLAYPPSGLQDVASASPPRFLFVWPNFMNLTCRLARCRIRHKRFNLAGQPTLFEAEMAIKEIRDVRLYSDDVFYNGTFRNTLPEEMDAS